MRILSSLRSPRWGWPQEDSALEGEFLRQYRRAALQGTLSAAIAAALIFAAFLLVARISEPYSQLAIFVRAGLVFALLVIALVVLRAPVFSERNYVALSASGSLLALAGTVYLLSIGPHGTSELAHGGSPALVFGLFLHYAFLRLPLWCAAGIGWAVSIASAVWASPLVIGGNAEVRTYLYLIFANIVGMAVCRSIEARERELFFQRRRAEAAQKELTERALAAEEAHMEKTRLLAAVSHDLRQPMMATTTYLAVLKSRIQKGDLDEADKHIAHLADSIGLLGNTLDHLLTAARYDSGTEPMRIETVELAPLLTQVEETFSAEAAQRGVDLRVRYPQGRVVVTTDATALWRVLMNLVSNAIKFTEADPRGGRGVVVRAALVDGMCRLDVADTGIGISQEHMESIWRPYFQVQNAQRDRSKGLGLGLFLVQRALEQMPGHRLALRSRLGRGSRFSIFLPGLRISAPRATGSGRPAVDAHDLATLAGAYVLVLEDDDEVRRSLVALLEDWGVLQDSGATLEELLPRAESSMRTVDALITDYRLPGGRTGAECIEQLRARLDEPVPSIIVTGESDLSRIQRRLPPDTVVIQKPFDSAALVEPLSRAVRRAREAESL